MIASSVAVVLRLFPVSFSFPHLLVLLWILNVMLRCVCDVVNRLRFDLSAGGMDSLVIGAPKPSACPTACDLANLVQSVMDGHLIPCLWTARDLCALAGVNRSYYKLFSIAARVVVPDETRLNALIDTELTAEPTASASDDSVASTLAATPTPATAAPSPAFVARMRRHWFAVLFSSYRREQIDSTPSVGVLSDIITRCAIYATTELIPSVLHRRTTSSGSGGAAASVSVAPSKSAVPVTAVVACNPALITSYDWYDVCKRVCIEQCRVAHANKMAELQKNHFGGGLPVDYLAMFKIMTIGSRFVGRTSLLNQLCGDLPNRNTFSISLPVSRREN